MNKYIRSLMGNKNGLVIMSWLALVNGMYFWHSLIGLVVTLSFFLFVPGMLILGLLDLPDSFRPYRKSFALGLSLLFLILVGLLVNELAVFGVKAPLSTLYIFIVLDVVTLILLGLNLKKNRIKTINFIFRLPKLSLEEFVVASLAVLMPVLAIFGAIRLNNGGNAVLTLILLGLIPGLFLWLIFRPKLERINPFVIFLAAAAVLLAVSMRGLYLTGHDVQSEFYVFNLVLHHKHWSMADYRNPYNACMSITVLPTVIAKITHLSPLYIYKVLFQLIFAFGMLPVYYFMKRLGGPRTALMGVLVFISFPTFLVEMPYLCRQEIAFIFFGLVILLTFTNMKRQPKTILTVLLLAGLILSHYSSSYVTLGVVFFAWIFYKILAKLTKIPSNDPFAIPLLSIPVILIALLFTFLWNTQITTSSAGLKNTLTQSFQGIIDHSSARSITGSYSLFAPATQSPPLLLDEFAGNDFDQVRYVADPTSPVTNLGMTISHIVRPGRLNGALRTFSAKVLQVLMLFGIAILFFRQLKKRSRQDVYFLALAFATVLLLASQTLLPQLSIDYGAQRFFQQALIILGLPIVVAAEFSLGFLPRAKEAIIPAFFVLLFLSLSGFIPQLTGGYRPQLALNNSGSDFDNFYIHGSELDSARWLLANRDPKAPVDMDRYSKLRFIQATHSNQLNPDPIKGYRRGAYVYLNYGNIHDGYYHALANGTILTYRLNFNVYNFKNIIYSNGGSSVLN